MELRQERNSSQATFPVQKKHSQLHIFLQIVQRAIVAAAREMHSERFAGESGEPFEFDLAVVHAAHFRIKQRLSWLSLLLHAKPDILPHLCSSFSGDENEMVRSPVCSFYLFNVHMKPGQVSMKTFSKRFKVLISLIWVIITNYTETNKNLKRPFTAWSVIKSYLAVYSELKVKRRRDHLSTFHIHLFGK